MLRQAVRDNAKAAVSVSVASPGYCTLPHSLYTRLILRISGESTKPSEELPLQGIEFFTRHQLTWSLGIIVIETDRHQNLKLPVRRKSSGSLSL